MVDASHVDERLRDMLPQRACMVLPPPSTPVHEMRDAHKRTKCVKPFMRSGSEAIHARTHVMKPFMQVPGSPERKVMQRCMNAPQRELKVARRMVQEVSSEEELAEMIESPKAGIALGKRPRKHEKPPMCLVSINVDRREFEKCPHTEENKLVVIDAVEEKHNVFQWGAQKTAAMTADIIKLFNLPEEQLEQELENYRKLTVKKKTKVDQQKARRQGDVLSPHAQNMRAFKELLQQKLRCALFSDQAKEDISPYMSQKEHDEMVLFSRMSDVVICSKHFRENANYRSEFSFTKEGGGAGLSSAVLTLLHLCGQIHLETCEYRAPETKAKKNQCLLYVRLPKGAFLTGLQFIEQIDFALADVRYTACLLELKELEQLTGKPSPAFRIMMKKINVSDEAIDSFLASR